VKRERLSDFSARTRADPPTRPPGETLEGDAAQRVSYETLDCVDNGFYDNTNVTRAARSFLHDGRQPRQLDDSRVLSAVGYVPSENIVGRAQ